MLPEVGATELLVLAIVALVVVGPKDLPVLMRKVGQWIGKMRGLAAEFRTSFDEMARQSELDELRKEVEALRNTQLPDTLTNLHPTFDEVSAGLDPHGFNIDSTPYPSSEPIPPELTTIEGNAPAPAPKPRAKRASKPKAEAEAAPADAPKAKRAPAKPRAKRPAASAEAEG
jgi:sec-independent protein translocase protein TatB